MMHPNFYIVIDNAMHNTGVAYFKKEQGKEAEVYNTFKISIDKKVKTEKCCIEMIRILLEDHLLPPNIVKWDGLIWERHTPHGKEEVMSMQGFAHMASIGIAMAGAAAYAGIPVWDYTPSEWKGTVKKEAMTKRLYANEVVNLTDPKLFSLKEHDILDAIGLGRFHFEKMEYLRRTGR